jgi:hypothetical protein
LTLRVTSQPGLDLAELRVMIRGYRPRPRATYRKAPAAVLGYLASDAFELLLVTRGGVADAGQALNCQHFSDMSCTESIPWIGSSGGLYAG